jgi:hypothetical protein
MKYLLLVLTVASAFAFAEPAQAGCKSCHHRHHPLHRHR